MRARHTIQQYRRADATETRDKLGGKVLVWGTPLDRLVYGWAAPSSAELRSDNTTVLAVDLVVYAPTFPVDSRDEFVVDGKRYTVEGETGDYDHGISASYKPGMVIKLKRGA